MPMKLASRAVLGSMACLISGLANADEQSSDAKFQSTYVWQRKPGFRSAYRSANSLSPRAGEELHLDHDGLSGLAALERR